MPHCLCMNAMERMSVICLTMLYEVELISFRQGGWKSSWRLTFLMHFSMPLSNSIAIKDTFLNPSIIECDVVRKQHMIH